MGGKLSWEGFVCSVFWAGVVGWSCSFGDDVVWSSVVLVVWLSKLVWEEAWSLFFWVEFCSRAVWRGESGFSFFLDLVEDSNQGVAWAFTSSLKLASFALVSLITLLSLAISSSFDFNCSLLAWICALRASINCLVSSWFLVSSSLILLLVSSRDFCLWSMSERSSPFCFLRSSTFFWRSSALIPSFILSYSQ